jgi:hypothetical protein
MFSGDVFTEVQVFKMKTERAERKAAEAHRFREFRTPEAKLATAIITSVLGLFIR